MALRWLLNKVLWSQLASGGCIFLSVIKVQRLFFLPSGAHLYFMSFSNISSFFTLSLFSFLLSILLWTILHTSDSRAKMIPSWSFGIQNKPTTDSPRAFAMCLPAQSQRCNCKHGAWAHCPHHKLLVRKKSQKKWAFSKRKGKMETGKWKSTYKGPESRIDDNWMGVECWRTERNGVWCWDGPLGSRPWKSVNS